VSWDINHVVLVGRLTRDPELTYTQSGSAVCRFSIAVNRTSASSAGGEENTSFFNIVAWNKTAEICNEYLSKGRQVAIDGRLQQRRWEGSDGMKRNTVEIVANNVQFFGPGRGGGRYGTAANEETADGAVQRGTESFERRESNQRSETRSVAEAGEERDPFLSELDDDEIPF
jgi:single-strand DNA-binding protein